MSFDWLQDQGQHWVDETAQGAAVLSSPPPHPPHNPDESTPLIWRLTENWIPHLPFQGYSREIFMSSHLTVCLGRVMFISGQAPSHQHLSWYYTINSTPATHCRETRRLKGASVIFFSICKKKLSSKQTTEGTCTYCKAC